MKRFFTTIGIFLCLLSVQPSWAESQAGTVIVDSSAQMRNDYIQASLLITDATSETRSIFGHCALRLQCPSQQMDYCFVFEPLVVTNSMVDFLSGRTMGGFQASQTSLYLVGFAKAGCGVKEYVLRLTPAEKLALWKCADEEITMGYCRHYDFMRTQGASKVVCLVTRALSTRVKYGNLPDFPDTSYRNMMLEACESYPWNAFFWQTVMGAKADETQPLTHRLTPQSLPLVWQKATIGNGKRHLIEGQGSALVESTVTIGFFNRWLTPVVLFTMLLMVVIGLTIAERRLNWLLPVRVVDIMLLALHTFLGIALLCLVLCSRMEMTQWNVYLIAFNPLPQFLWLTLPNYRLWIFRVMLVVLLLFIAMTPFVPQLDAAHALLVACIAVRLFQKIIVKR